MCGIGGIVSWGDPVAADRIARIGAAVAHRGPDGAGHLDRGWYGFAHRRLAIIDPAGSAQPMTDPTGRYALTFNGEIFNFRELRDDLRARGREFRTSGDVEVLLNLLIADGSRALSALDGQFAFAFADEAAGTVLLARDRSGIKPLYVARRDREAVFSSELAGVLAVVPRPPVSPEAVDLYLTLRYVPAPWTIHEGIAKLAPGCAMTIHRDGRVEGPVVWHAIDAAAPRRDCTEEEIETALAAAVRSQLVADVPLGALLSGGIDSSVVALLASDGLRPQSRLCTITAGFPDPEHDERPHARKVAAALRSDHHAILVEPPGDGGVADFAAFGEPFADSSVVPSAALFSAARTKVTVALGGDGGDELFFGYRAYHRALTGELARRRAATSLSAGAWIAARRMASPRFRRLFAEAPLDILAGTRTMIGAAARRRLYRGTRIAALPEPLPGTAYLATLARRALDAAAGDPIEALMIFDRLGFLPECALVKVDRLSMRRGLEVRVPLLANAVVDLARALPVAHKARATRGACTAGKEPLRRLLERRIPALDVARRKRGFGAPKGFGGDAVVRALLPESALRDGPLGDWCDPGEAARILWGEAPGVRAGEAALTIAVLGAFLERSGGGAP